MPQGDEGEKMSLSLDFFHGNALCLLKVKSFM